MCIIIIGYTLGAHEPCQRVGLRYIIQSKKYHKIAHEASRYTCICRLQQLYVGLHVCVMFVHSAHDSSFMSLFVTRESGPTYRIADNLVAIK